ncbi:uncharacterized protein LOC130771003 [Actinidia eriantha]|uniref:uncharacterized protein LOC130771003 n=1 Tax=Actinidia eriantha TaxID=165200 RepID=UPI00258F13BD|nr:uncharacterized protein LOC130771003 [Actinidia eriantha]
MSENRDKGKGVEDEEGKKLEDMKDQQEAEIEKAKDACKEGISSSSTPLKETATDTKSGGSSRTRRPGKEISEDTAPINKTGNELTRKIFLFETHLTPSDVEEGRLFLPVESALDYFPYISELQQKSYEEEIKVTDPRDRVWTMKIRYDSDECGYLMNSEWHDLAKCHGLRARDKVQFYVPFPLLQENHYLIEYVRTEESGDIISFPEFRRLKLLFEREVTAYEVKYRRLIFSMLEVISHFSVITIPAETHDVERLCFTDALNKDWWFKIKFYCETYLVIGGWEEFVNEYKVEAGDVIKFYKMVRPFSPRQFLIMHYKKGDEAAGTRATNDWGWESWDDDSIMEQIRESSWTRRPGKEVLDKAPKMDTGMSRLMQKIFLFETHLTPSDVEEGRLFIPVESALDYFPYPSKRKHRSYKDEIKVTDSRDRVWTMKLRYDSDECGYIMNSEWHDFAKCHGLRARDKVQFYVSIPLSQENHYLIEYVRTEESGDIISFPEVWRLKLLLERKVTASEVKDRRLIFSMLEVRNHFSVIKIPAETHDVERLCFTDALNKDWWFKIKFYFADESIYLVTGGWEEFVNEYQVEAGDVIQFYKMVQPFCPRQFLILHIKKGRGDEAAKTSARNDGGGDRRG